MKSKELRIGNLVNCDFYDNEPIIVESICSYDDGIFNGKIGDVSFHSLHPIPLTEEWLLKLPKDCVFPTWIKYVHTLQNWYYYEYKCEKELTIK